MTGGDVYAGCVAQAAAICCSCAAATGRHHSRGIRARWPHYAASVAKRLPFQVARPTRFEPLTPAFGVHHINSK